MNTGAAAGGSVVEVKIVPNVKIKLKGRMQDTMSWYGRGVRGSRGFTTIELLVVIGVIAVLAAISLTGYHMVSNKMKIKGTQTTLGSLQSMLTEAEGAGLYKRQPRGVYEFDVLTPGTPPRIDGSWRPIKDASGGDLPVPVTGLVADFWRRPDANAPVLPTPAGGTNPMVAPANVVMDPPVDTADQSEVYQHWRDMALMRNTAIAIAMLRTVPSVAAMMDKLPNGVARTAEFWSPQTEYPAGTRLVVPPVPNTKLATAGTGGAGGPNGYMVAVAGSRVLVTDPVPNPFAPGKWALDYAAVRDSWGRPIVFVPACGIRVNVNGAATTITAPDGKPFWASAGADGDLSKGDDNVYSFEQ